jgi:hypothetical protein
VYLIPGRQLQTHHVAIVPGLYDLGKLRNIQVWLSSYDLFTYSGFRTGLTRVCKEVLM